MLKNVALAAVAVVAVGLTQAHATEIDGDIQFSGNVAYLGGSGDAATATGLDFLQNGSISGATPGSLIITGTDGTLSSVFNNGDDCVSLSKGGCGQISDISKGSLGLGYGPVSSFMVFNLDGITATVNFTDITSLVAAGSGINASLALAGIGTLVVAGYDLTNIDFSFAFHGSNGSTSKVSFSGDVEFVPEPSSILVFGTAFMGLGVLLMRRRQSV